VHPLVRMPVPCFSRDCFETSVRLEHSSYGTPTPTLWVTAQPELAPRQLAALLHWLAMWAELKSSVSDRWVISIDVTGDRSGKLSIETLSGTGSEAQRGMALLQSVIDDASDEPTRESAGDTSLDVRGLTLEVKLERAPYLEPTLWITASESEPHASIAELAGWIEAEARTLTPETERWTVGREVIDLQHACVFVELERAADGEARSRREAALHREARRAMALLRRVRMRAFMHSA
jgi:hypothetical protein